MQRLHDHAMPLLRLYAGGDAIISWYNSFSDPFARLARIAQTQDGGVLIWIMAIVGIAIVLDVFVNDWTPSRIKIGKHSIQLAWNKVFRHRHFLFVALAFCYAAQPYVAERGGYAISLLVWFYWNSMQTIVIGFLDAKQRSRSIGWQRAIS